MPNKLNVVRVRLFVCGDGGDGGGSGGGGGGDSGSGRKRKADAPTSMPPPRKRSCFLKRKTLTGLSFNKSEDYLRGPRVV